METNIPKSIRSVNVFFIEMLNILNVKLTYSTKNNLNSMLPTNIWQIDCNYSFLK